MVSRAWISCLLAGLGGVLSGIALFSVGLVDANETLSAMDFGASLNLLPWIAFASGLATWIGLTKLAHRTQIAGVSSAWPSPEAVQKKPRWLRRSLGAACFGTGLGLAGYWPASALVAAAAGVPAAIVMAVAMLMTMAALTAARRILLDAKKRRSAPGDTMPKSGPLALSH